MHKSKNAVASSLININEATAAELQRLKGIGPTRSTYIVDFRERVALIRNPFDLAAATGLSVKAAEKLSNEIEWTSGRGHPFGLWPAAFFLLASIWLIVTGFDQLTRGQFAGPQGYYNLSVALILLGGLSATGHIAISTFLIRPMTTSWLSVLAAFLFSTGFIILIILLVSGMLTDYPLMFQQSLDNTGRFMAYCALMSWLVFGPAFCLRLFIEDRQLVNLDISKFIYDLSLLSAPFLPMYHLLFHNEPTWTSEIFSLWCAAVLVFGSSEMIRGRSAFVGMLSEIDQSRFRFVFFTRGRKEMTNDTARALGWVCLAEATVLIAAVAGSAIRL